MIETATGTSPAKSKGMLDDLFDMFAGVIGVILGAILVVVLILFGVDHLLGTGFAEAFLDWVKAKASSIGGG